MYTFQYQNEELIQFATAKEAVKYFDSKGWGFHNFKIAKDNVRLTLEQFWNELDKERIA